MASIRNQGRPIYLLTVLAVACAAVAAYVFRTPAAAQGGAIDPPALYKLFQSKRTRSVQFAEGGWGYHVEMSSPDRLYIAGVKGRTTQAAAAAAFAPATAVKAADLMIIACGAQFADDGCDFYSPLNEIPVNGGAIREAKGAMAQYQDIVDAAAVALGGGAR